MEPGSYTPESNAFQDAATKALPFVIQLIMCFLVLDAVEQPGFLDRVQRVSDRFAEELSGFPFRVRRKGLMMALKFEVPDAGMMAMKMLYDQGIFAFYAHHDTSALQFLPPLTILDEEIEEVMRIFHGIWG